VCLSINVTDLETLYLFLLNFVLKLWQLRKTYRPRTSKCSTTPLIRTLVIRIANYPDRLGFSGKFVALKLPFIGSSTIHCSATASGTSNQMWSKGLDADKGKGKAIPLQALSGPEASRRLRLPDFKTIGTLRWQGCQPYAPAAFTPRKYSWYSFLLEAGTYCKY
jgi:hypothetical protein